MSYLSDYLMPRARAYGYKIRANRSDNPYGNQDIVIIDKMGDGIVRAVVAIEEVETTIEKLAESDRARRALRKASR